MEKLNRFVSNDGTVLSVPESDMPDFVKQVNTDGTQVQPLHSFRGSDGTNYKVPESELSDFQKQAQSDGVTLQPLYRVRIGNEKFAVPESETDQFLRQYHTSPKYTADREATTKKINDYADSVDESQRVAQYGEAARHMKPEGQIQSFAREAVTDVIPGVATYLGGTAGAVGGAALGVPTGPGAAATTAAGAVGGAALGGKIGGIINRGIEKLFDPETVAAYKAQSAVNEGSIGKVVGQLVGSAPAMLAGGAATKAIGSAVKMAPRVEGLVQNAIAGSAMEAGSEASRPDATFGGVAKATARGGITFAPLALAPVAKTILGQVLRRAPTEAAVQAVSSVLYDHITSGKPINGKEFVEDIQEKTGENIPMFMLMGAASAVMEGKPFARTQLGKVAVYSKGAFKDFSKPTEEKGNAVQEGKGKQGAPASEVSGAVGKEVHGETGETVLREPRPVSQGEKVSGAVAEPFAPMPEADLHVAEEPGQRLEEKAASDAAIGKYEGNLADVKQIVGIAKKNEDGTASVKEFSPYSEMPKHDDFGKNTKEADRGFFVELKNGEMAYLDREQGMKVAKRTGQLNDKAEGDSLHSHMIKQESKASAERRMSIDNFMESKGAVAHDSMIGRLLGSQGDKLARPTKNAGGEWDSIKNLPKELLNKIMVSRGNKTGLKPDELPGLFDGETLEQIADQMGSEWEEYQNWKAMNGPSMERMMAEHAWNEMNREAMIAAANSVETMDYGGEKVMAAEAQVKKAALAEALGVSKEELKGNPHAIDDVVREAEDSLNNNPYLLPEFKARFLKDPNYSPTSTEVAALSIEIKRLQNVASHAAKMRGIEKAGRADPNTPTVAEKEWEDKEAAAQQEELGWSIIASGTGTTAGRNLNLRRWLGLERNSLPTMLRESARALGKAVHELTEDEKREVRDHYQKVHAAFDAASVKEIEAAERMAMRGVGETHRNLDSDIRNDMARNKQASPEVKAEKAQFTPRFEKMVQDLWDKYRPTIESHKAESDQAWVNLDALGRQAAGQVHDVAGAAVHGAKVAAEMAKIARYYVELGTYDAAKFSTEVLAKGLDIAAPVIQKAWNDAQREHEKVIAGMKRQAAEMLGKKENNGLPSRDLPPKDQRDLLIDKGRKLAQEEGWKNSAYRIAKSIGKTFLQENLGLKAEELAAMVHKEMVKIDPTMTESDSRRALAGTAEYTPKTRNQVNDALAAIRKELNALYKKPEDAKKNAAAIAAANKRLKEYQRRIAEGDFETKPKAKFEYSKEVDQARAEANKAQQKYKSALHKWEMGRRSKPEKAIDMLVELRRASILSSLTVGRTLTEAGAFRGVQMRAEALTGSVLSHLPGVKNIAAESKMDKSFSVSKELGALVKAWTDGFHDAYQRIKYGQADIDILQGAKGKGMQEYLNDIPVLRYIGHMHFALKSVVFRDAYERYLAYRIPVENEAGTLGDGMRVRNEAYEYALRQILQNDNSIVKEYQRIVNKWDKNASESGSITGKALVGIVKAEIPIVKVPTNMVAEVIEHVAGLAMPLGNKNFWRAIKSEAYKLPPEHAEIVMRQFRKGAIGAGMMALGFFMRNYIGGLYVEADKKAKGNLNFGEERIGDVSYQGNHIHSALMRAIDYGATVGHIFDSGTKGVGGFTDAAAVSALGLVRDVPQFGFMGDITRIGQPGAFQHFKSQQMESFEQIGAVSSIARMMDAQKGSRNAVNFYAGEVNKRYPRTIKEHFFTGIPYLRQEVSDRK